MGCFWYREYRASKKKQSEGLILDLKACGKMPRLYLVDLVSKQDRARRLKARRESQIAVAFSPGMH